MFQVGGQEFLVILIVALVAIGPEQLPTAVRKIGKWAGQFRTMTSGLREEFMSGIEEIEASVKEPIQEIQKSFAEPMNELERSIGETGVTQGAGSDDDPIVPRGFAENAIATTAGPLGIAEPAEDDGDDAPVDDETDDENTDGDAAEAADSPAAGPVEDGDDVTSGPVAESADEDDVTA